MHDGSILSEQLSATLSLRTRLVHGSRLLMNDSWRAVAASRRRILRRLVIAGGASVEGPRDGGLCDGRRDNRLHVRVRALLLNQTMPIIDGRSWAGMGSGVNHCACCGEMIRPGHAEYEPEIAAGLYAHAECFIIWRQESAGLSAHDRRVDGGRPRETASGA